MPIPLSSAVIVPPPTSPTTPTPGTVNPQIIRNPVPQKNNRGTPIWSLSFIGNDRTIRFSMSCNNLSEYLALSGMQGTDLPPTEIFSDALPDSHGSVFRGWRYNTREMFFPISVIGTNYADNRDKMRVLWEMFRGAQEVSVGLTQPDGSARYIKARYVSGLEGNYGGDSWTPRTRTIGLTVVALSPWWYGTQQNRQWSLSQNAVRPFLSKTTNFFPVVLGKSSVVGLRTVQNVGTTDAWPTIVITGPGTDPIIENQTTGKQINITKTLSEGDKITIETKPGYQDVLMNGTEIWNNVSLDSELWGLAKDENDVLVTLTNASTSSRIEMSWSPLFETGH